VLLFFPLFRCCRFLRSTFFFLRPLRRLLSPSVTSNFTLSSITGTSPASFPALLHATMSAVASASRVSLSRPVQKVSACCQKRAVRGERVRFLQLSLN
jgi:hypothetical protein